MNTTISRRAFLRGSSGAMALTLMNLHPRSAEAQDIDVRTMFEFPEVSYTEFEDVYRNQWKWDSVARGTHFVNCWYQRGCNWNVYVKDGVVWREEQAGIYDPISPDIPDYNPRGCQKGACYSERMYDESRLRHPLKRVGERGAGSWQRVSWDEALTDIADHMIDVLVSEEDGPASIVWDQGTAQTSGGAGLAMLRTTLVLDTPVLDNNAEIGDHRPGVAVTLGKMVFCSSSDDVFHSDLIMIWGGNPIYTQIPNAHFMLEARYNGAKIITISPDYSASAVHADQWVPVKVASDAALGLSMAHVMIEEGIYNAAFVKEQTDLPLLVHIDSGRFLRESELVKGGAEDRFYVHDAAGKGVVKVPHKTLALDGMNPDLEGEFEVAGLSGTLRVTPVFARLREHLRQYTPEEASEICGVGAKTIRSLARQLARARAATCVTQSNFSKFYHGIEMERAQILCFALAGQMGRKGAGYMGFPYMSVDAIGSLAAADGQRSPKLALAALGLRMAPEILKLKWKGFTSEMIMYELGRRSYKGEYVSSLLWLYHQGGMEDTYGQTEKWDKEMKRPLASYMDEAIEKGWQLPQKNRPRIFMEAGGNVLRRFRAYDKVAERLLPMLDLMVTIDWRMSSTALYSDYVLPAAAWYEKDDITWATPLSPFSQVVTRAAEPVGEAKTDWEIHCLLLKTIQRRAAERGLTHFRDQQGKQRKFDVYDEFTFGGRYHEGNVEEFLDLILDVSTNVGDVNWEQLKKKGFQRFTSLPENDYLTVGNATDVSEHDTITAGLWHTEKKMPWPTLTRRMQFCIDHPFYEELGEVLPVHKEQPAIGGDYPLHLTGGHARWSIHSSWRDQRFMQQLNRGQPLAFISVEDAAERGIVDGDMIRVFNDVGSTELMAKVAAAHRPGQVTVYHAWEPHMSKGRHTVNTVTPNPINPLQLAGGYFHIQVRPAEFTPGSTDRATRVEVEKVASAADRIDMVQLN